MGSLGLRTKLYPNPSLKIHGFGDVASNVQCMLYFSINYNPDMAWQNTRVLPGYSSRHSKLHEQVYPPSIPEYIRVDAVSVLDSGPYRGGEKEVHQDDESVQGENQPIPPIAVI